MENYDLIIIGGGPAGAAAAVYAARKRLKSALIAGEWGGQSVVSDGIENWIGTISISGEDLAKSFEAHVKKYAEDVVDVKVPEWAKGIKTNDDGTSTVVTDKGEYKAKSILITTGSKRRRLSVPGADEFEHKGLTYCASCDGPLFSGQDTVVIGGGNAAFETAAQLLAYAKSVTLLNRGDSLKADPVTVEEVKKDEKFTLIMNANTKEILGDKFVSGITYTDSKTNEDTTLEAKGIFVEIGLIPNTDIAKDVVEMNDYGQIVIDPWTQRTNVTGIWAAGDCTNVKYHQNNIAAGHAVTAVEDIYLYVKTGK